MLIKLLRKFIKQISLKSNIAKKIWFKNKKNIKKKLKKLYQGIKDT